MPESEPNPILVEVTRGRHVECRHRGAAAVARADGEVVAAWGEVGAAVYPRSAIKPVQAIPLVESGAADAAGLSEAELALACASHGGEARHTEAVAAWLDRLGLSVEDLECGTHAPSTPAAAARLQRDGAAPSALHNNCSGKHAGMLTLARHLGIPTRHYIAADHPVQAGWRAVLGDLADEDLDDSPTGIDGCSIPTVAVSIAGLARSAARFAVPEGLAPARTEACRRIVRAIGAEPFMIAGSDRLCTRIAADTGGRVIAKNGAEGVYWVALPAAGLGIALKIDDGAARASEVAVLALIARYADLPPVAAERLRPRMAPAVLNRKDTVVGDVRAAADWLDID